MILGDDYATPDGSCKRDCVDFKVEVVARQEGDPAELVADNTKLKEKMQWSPKFDDLEVICRSALELEKKIYEK